MTPDMKRLCEVVRVLELDDELEHQTDSTGTGVKFGDVCGSEFVKAIVRAVLTELREMSEDTRIVALNTGLPQMGEPPLYEKVWLGVIDHILTEPATA